MKRHVVALAFAALATSAHANPVIDAMKTLKGIILPAPAPVPDSAPAGGDVFARIAGEINLRSITNCAPELDVPEKSSQRETLLALPSERESNPDSLAEIMSNMGLTNAGRYAVCYDTRLQDGGPSAVVYNGPARIIALNPSAPDPEHLLRLAFSSVYTTWNAANGKDPDEWPQVVGPAGTKEPPATAPHRLPEYSAAPPPPAAAAFPISMPE